MPRLIVQLFMIAVFAFTLSLGISAAVYDRAFAQGSAQAQASATEQPAASTPKAAPNPDDPAGFVAEIGAAWSRGAYLTVSLLVLYGGLFYARRRIVWLATGRRAVVVAAAITALTTAILGLSTGNGPTLAWAANAIAAAVALYLRTDALPAATATAV